MGCGVSRQKLPLVCLVAALGLMSCGESSTESLRTGPSQRQSAGTGLKVVVVGIDGATFDVIDRLEEGRLPTFRQLMKGGVRAPLSSFDPALSPVIWTTIATGLPPQAHGIEGFLTEADSQRRRLVSSTDRKKPALWNLLTAARRPAGVVGWWVTWPAEPVTGFVVSDQVAYARHQFWSGDRKTAHLTYPADLYDELRAHIVDPRKPPLDELLQLADLDQDEIDEMLAAERPILFHWLSVLKTGYCEQRTYEEMALRLLSSRGQPDLLLLLLIATDPISHTFWHFYEPEAFDGVDPEQAARLGPVIPAIYEHNDGFLANLMSQLGQDTVLIVISDHGFGPSGTLPESTRNVRYGSGRPGRTKRPVNVGQPGEHRREGIFIASGGPIRKGAQPETTPSVLDVAPTVLALLGLPVGRDMPGRVLSEFFQPEFLARHPVRYVDSWPSHLRHQGSEDLGDEESPRLEYLRSLGYVD